jgi:glycosyltransferase involved in cell wall biosynthesis
MPTISYAITACNEHEELKRLLDQLIQNKRDVDEIVVQVDYETVTEDVMYMLRFVYSKDIASIIKFPLNKDFATFKNNIKQYCKNDYIFFIDADEYLSENLMYQLPLVLENNAEVDMFSVPRSNTIKGLTDSHVRQWRWMIDTNGRVNWPDYQNRIIKNIPNIHWINKVHERIDGFTTTCLFPNNDEDWCLYHPKTIEKQEKQNNFYTTI